MSIIDSDSVYDFLEIEDDENAVADKIHRAVEKSVEQYCNRTFSAMDFKEFYSGKGAQKLMLKHYPIILVKGVYLDTLEVMRVYNTNKYTTAIVSVNSTGLTLEYNNVLTANDLSFVTNTTLTALSVAINNVGNGWTAEVLGDYGDIISSEILELAGQNAINSNKIDLKIPWASSNQYRCDFLNGIVFFDSILPPYNEMTENPLFLVDHTRFIEANDGVFSNKYNNVFIKYRAGYEEEDMPEDIQTAVLLAIKDLYSRQQENSVGLTEYYLNQVISKSFDKTLNEKSRFLLQPYRNIKI